MTEKKKQDIPMSFKLDDFFTTQNDRDDDNKEKIEKIDISLIDSFTNHPFKIIENEDFKALQESIKTNGILSPAIVRKKENGNYEMISGHRRKYACQLLGINSMPCIVKELSDDEATIYMVDSNLQREKILPSEKAYAYKLKYEAMKHQGKRNDLTSGPVDQKLSSEKIAKESKESEKTVRRYIRLTNLIPKLLEMVDNSEIGQSPSIAIRPAVEVSYLNDVEQQLLFNFIEKNITTPSLEQAKKLKELSKEGSFNEVTMVDIMNKEKPNQVTKFKIQEDKLYKVLPKNIKREKVEEFILKACSYYTERLKRRDIER